MLGTTKVEFILWYINPEECLADQRHAFCRIKVPYS